MFWNESDAEQQPTVPKDVVDVVFRIDCRRLPMDHAWSLSTAVQEHLPWIKDLDKCGIHLIHGAESGNGWQRPENESHLILSKRTRFTIRVPASMQKKTQALSGKTLSIDDCEMIIGKASIKTLSDSKILFCRHLHCDDADTTEEEFLTASHGALQELRIRPGKMMCGRMHKFNTPDAMLHSRSLMLAGLKLDAAVKLQEQGLGKYRARGFGLFIPHRGIDAVYKKPDE
ncbi:MAG: CRISPR-associated protein Cas6 [Parasphingorhabdus sp.]|jgi:CRISPR-associated protein Cas6